MAQTMAYSDSYRLSRQFHTVKTTEATQSVNLIQTIPVLDQHHRYKISPRERNRRHNDRGVAFQAKGHGKSVQDIDGTGFHVCYVT